MELLRAEGVAQLADVRRFPGSRRHPQHRRDALEAALAAAGIGYAWLGESLGGRRRSTLPAERSPNRAWQVAGFRAYADAMPTPEFQSGVETLETLARERPTAMMCAERLWWRCHRRLLADVMAARGWRVVHLLEPGRRDDHTLTGWARVEGTTVTYPGLL